MRLIILILTSWCLYKHWNGKWSSLCPSFIYIQKTIKWEFKITIKYFKHQALHWSLHRVGLKLLIFDLLTFRENKKKLFTSKNLTLLDVYFTISFTMACSQLQVSCTKNDFSFHRCITNWTTIKDWCNLPKISSSIIGHWPAPISKPQLL